MRVVPCSLSIHSDPRLLEQMIRNLLSNALKYTKRGKVLLGCRRREGTLSIEVWDTGVGIPGEELQAIFEEYHQLDNAARERSRGLGLGLSIVQRLGNLLGHRIRVRSRPGQGLGLRHRGPAAVEQSRQFGFSTIGAARMPGRLKTFTARARFWSSRTIPKCANCSRLLLTEKGHRAATAPDGVAALELVEQGAVQPDLILADYNLPNGLDGLQLTAKVREKLHRPVPVIILTGDISTDTLREIAA